MKKRKINSRAKGASGEREFCRWLYENLNIPMPTRNLEQVRSGGSDIIDVEPFYFEVKRCENLLLGDWWIQVNKSVPVHTEKEIVPIVAFRKNNMSWEFLIPASYINVDRGYVRVTSRVFLKWIRNNFASYFI